MPEIDSGDPRPPVRLLLVRHGQQVRGAGADPPLTTLGCLQAQAAARAVALTDADRLVSSTRRRAVETAQAFGVESQQVADLDEFRFGSAWTWDRMDAHDYLSLWRPDHDGGAESLRQFQTRVESALRQLIAEPPAGAGRLVVVVHGGVIGAVLRWAFGLGPEVPWTAEAVIPHASVTRFDHWTGGRHPQGAPTHTLVVRLADVTHLEADQVTE